MRTMMTQTVPRALLSTRQVMVRFGRSETGATSIEYSLILALMAVVCIVSFNLLGNSNTGGWSSMANKAVAGMTK